MPMESAIGAPKMVGGVPVKGLDAIADVDADRTHGSVVAPAEPAREVKVAEANVGLVGGDVAHVAERREGERPGHLEPNLVRELPQRRATDRDEALTRVVAD